MKPPRIFVTATSHDRTPVDQFIKSVCMEKPEPNIGVVEGLEMNFEFIAQAFGRLVGMWLENSHADDRAAELNYILFGYTENGPVTEVRLEKTK